MERLLYKELLNWKNSNERKPLILNGARQVGKTWLLKHFAENEYEDYIYINCDNNPSVDSLFKDYDIARILRHISAITGKEIKGNSMLLVFDEIQTLRNGLSSLKYFCENAPDYHVAVAGSLLGIKMSDGTGFPVGKVDFLTLYPLSFKEFLLALGKNTLVKYLDEYKWNEYYSLSDTLVELLRQYYYVGGMPEVVENYVFRGSINKVREIQNKILLGYENDFSKHIGKDELQRVINVWFSIPNQLAKENKKFIWGMIRKGSRAKDYENAIGWLNSAGLVHKAFRVHKVGMPLKFYEEFSSFKLFLNDLGLLGAMADIPPSEILASSKMITEYKGAFTEEYIAQQLLSFAGTNIFYYSNENSTSEIEFVLQTDKVYPIEVKAEENLKSKSLSTVLKTDSNLRGIRFSMSNYRKEKQMVNVPLYLADWYIEYIVRNNKKADQD